MPDDSTPAQLKDWFDDTRYRSLAGLLSRVSKRFQADAFLKCVLEGLAERSLLERVHQCALGIDAALPGTFRDKVAVLRKLAPKLDHEFVAIFMCDFVATFGRNEPEFALESLSFFTVYGSAEFAVRPFIIADQSNTLATMLQWTQDADEKVRRLASEGSRPRLPWGMQLTALVRDPSPTAAILEALKEDESLFVRRSVANHLNDITKDHPELVLQRLESWDLENPKLAWIAKHACRTLIKRGNPRALKLFGFGKKAEVTAALTLAPAVLSLGDRLATTAVITSTAKKVQRLVVDYVIHYVKANGSSAEKVFKWTELELAPKATLTLTKTQVIRDFTTRKHYAGHHKVELQVNGQRLASAVFELR
ncbi:MAG: DNA alkylation repair protein [Verrucomicrobiales bacterium]|nr:DNA alkylation repair protein [Verrucomicrobiales bacterium]MCP5557538.1 DNA alkylation repair protein [Verrucomicrobiaceae bacterium]